METGMVFEQARRIAGNEGQGPLSDAGDQTACFRYRNENLWADHLAAWPEPSDQGLRTAPSAGLQIDDRLIFDEELVSPERCPKNGRQSQLLPGDIEYRQCQRDARRGSERNEHDGKPTQAGCAGSD